MSSSCPSSTSAKMVSFSDRHEKAPTPESPEQDGFNSASSKSLDCIKSIPNFRDVSDTFVCGFSSAELAGDPAASRTRSKCSTSSIRSRLVFRSSSPWLASSQEAHHLAGTLGIRLVIDMRTPTEQRQGAESGESDGPLADLCAKGEIRLVRAPLLDENLLGRNLFRRGSFVSKMWMLTVALGLQNPEDIQDTVMAEMGKLGLQGMYKTILEGSADQIGKCLQEISKPESLPVLVHCTSGKDRTGVLIALILNLLGFSDEEVVADYTLTEQFTSQLFDTSSSSLVSTIGNYVGDHMKMAPKHVMHETIEYIRQSYGSIPEYLNTKANFSFEDQARLRHTLSSATRL